jgi:signal transduction histidine kinase
MGELSASIAHEVNQPLAAIITNGQACGRFLGFSPPDLDEVKDGAGEIARDKNRWSVCDKHGLKLRPAMPDKIGLVRFATAPRG